MKTRRYWGTQRVARVCQVSPATVANWIDQGLLKGHKTPTGRRRVSGDDLTAFLRAHAMAVPPELERGSGPDMVVVVDDDPAYLKALVLTIERSDLDVEVVELPDLNAPQVIRRLLEPGRKLDAEVLVVTGGMPEAAGNELREMGVKVILSKAEEMPAVVEAMRQALQRRKAA
ncbi:MAG: hypothetical protein DMD67_03000 [Gemmatimonadetes bacterium]|nr:MAG: hypothetical protein DMD67_03000 [Gemmatimonadota bacterium]